MLVKRIKNKNKNKNETEEDNNGIIQIPFAPSAYEDSIEEKISDEERITG